MTDTLLRTENLVKTYGGSGLFGESSPFRALDSVNLEVNEGTIHGIVGESGCGKSTLARIVTALDRPTAGRVIFDGHDLQALSPRALRRIRPAFQMVFQDPYGSLDPRHSVGRIVAEPLDGLAERPTRIEKRCRVAEVLSSVGLSTEDARRRPHEFSGGQRQRIAIARALVTRPKLIVADEPVSALDLSVQAQVLNLLMDLRDTSGVTILFIGHDLSVIEAICDEISVMHEGQIVEHGPAETVLSTPQHSYTRELSRATPRLHLGTPPI